MALIATFLAGLAIAGPPSPRPVDLDPGVWARGLDREALVARLSELRGPDGGPPGVYGADAASERIVRGLGEWGSDGACRVEAARDPALTWTLTVPPGATCVWQIPGPTPRWHEVGIGIGPSVGNRGGGGLLSVEAGTWWDHRARVAGRVWGTGEVAPGLRLAGGAEIGLTLLAGGAFVEIAPGLAVNLEEREVCPEGRCTTERRGPLVGPTLGGDVGYRGWTAGEQAIAAALRVRSVPGRGFLVAAMASISWGRPGGRSQ